VDLALGGRRHAFLSTAQTPVILLDTNALLWLRRGHPRSRPLIRSAGRLYVSPVTVLELQLLVEVGRLRLRSGATVSDLIEDDRWVLDDPPAARWFEFALAGSWTRDPFDRLLVAHAQLRAWRIATGDAAMLEHSSGRCLAL